MILCAGLADVGSITIEWEPEVFDEVVSKRLPDSAIKLQASGVRGPVIVSYATKSRELTMDT